MAPDLSEFMKRVPRRAVTAFVAAVTFAGVAAVASAERVPTPVPASAQMAGARTPVPFASGEKLDYEVRFGSLRVGQGQLQVHGIETVRGREAWHASFSYSGSALFLKVNDKHETWFDTETLSSLRFHQDIDEGSYEATRRYEIFPERGMFRQNDKPEEPTPQQPLDDASFLYFVRTLPLKTGDDYRFSRYFKAQGNPVRIRVLRRETVKVPAGTFKAVVVQPTFQTKGLFSEGGRAEVWISDDPARIVLQLKSKLSVGSINLYLKGHNTQAGK
jgi:hypothetical protein